MAVQNASWDVVADRIDALRTHVGNRLDKLGSSAAAERAAVVDSVRALITALEEGFGAAGEAVRDPRLRRDLAGLVEALRQALVASVESTGADLRERLPRAARVVAKSSASKSSASKASASKASANKPAAIKSVGKQTAAKRTGASKAAPRKAAAAAQSVARSHASAR